MLRLLNLDDEKFINAFAIYAQLSGHLQKVQTVSKRRLFHRTYNIRVIHSSGFTNKTVQLVVCIESHTGSLHLSEVHMN